MRVIWEPLPKQAAFMRRGEDEALYGGAAGGGKSDAIVAEALRQVHIPHYKGLILRKTYPQLAELVDKTLNYYTRAFPQAKYNESKHVWLFPSGAKIYFGSMQHTKDKLRYQGQAYDYIAFDELTHFTFDEYSYLFSRNRPNGPGTRCYIRATANPGGVGHGWVKERFIIPAPPMTTIWDAVKIRFPDGREEERRKSRVYVPATVFDNPKMLQNDPEYLTRLASMPEAEKQALLYGNWDTFAGQVFTEWRDDPDHYHDRLNTHVIQPFLIPEGWRIVSAMDWGYTRPFSIGWYAYDREGTMYRIREFYGINKEGTPNVGARMSADAVAKEMRRIEAEDPNLKGREIARVADPAIWASQGTESIERIFRNERIYWQKAVNDRINGKMQVHHRLAFDERGKPMLQVFNTCRHFIRTVPNLVYDQADVEDVDTDGEDHIYDELRYACMRHPISPRENVRPKLWQYDPLSTEDVKYDPYAWYRVN